jgi:hydroxymethylbilane synthase
MTVTATLRIGTRRSRLARVQAEIVSRALAAAGTAEMIELVEISTHGDALSSAHPRGGFEATDGQFTAELGAAVRDGRVDLAVHSYKDLPTTSDGSTALAAVLPRADARDCLVGGSAGLASLPPGAVVGTGSVRRTAQLLAARPDLEFRPIRGNVETRIRRVQEGEYDAVVLACAGLDRLGIRVAEAARLPFEVLLPAPAQGALAVEVRRDRRELIRRLAAIDHALTRLAAATERELLAHIGGGCLSPLGTYAEVADGRLRLRAALAVNGRIMRADVTGGARERGRIVEAVAHRLLAAEDPR